MASNLKGSVNKEEFLKGIKEALNGAQNAQVDIELKPKLDAKEIQEQLDKEKYTVRLDTGKIAEEFKKIAKQYQDLMGSLNSGGSLSKGRGKELKSLFTSSSNDFVKTYGLDSYKSFAKGYGLSGDVIKTYIKDAANSIKKQTEESAEQVKQKVDEVKEKKKKANKEVAEEEDRINNENALKEIERIKKENNLKLSKTQEYYDEVAKLNKTRSVYEDGKGFTLTTEEGNKVSYDIKIDKLKQEKALAEQMSNAEAKKQKLLQDEQEKTNALAEDYYETLLKTQKVKEEILKEGKNQEILNFQSQMSGGASKGQQLANSNQIIANLKDELEILDEEQKKYEEIYETSKKELVNADLRRDIEAKVVELKQIEQSNTRNSGLLKSIDAFSDKELKRMNTYELTLSRINGRLNKYRQTKEVIAAKDTANDLQVLINKYKDFIKQLESMDPHSAEFEDLKKQIIELGKQVDNTKFKLEEMNQGLQTQGKFLLNLRDSFKTAIRSFTTYLSVTTVVYASIRTIKNMVREVTELDTALVELRKVTNLTNQQLKEFKQEAFEIADVVGRTGSEVLNAEAEFARAGFGEGEIANLAETAIVLTNVGDGIEDVTSAASSMISVLKAFKMEASESIHIIDALNEVSNNFAVDASNLTMVLERVSGTIAQTGTSYEELIGLTVGGYETLRNAEMVASGLNMISQRMRGMKEDGEAVEGLIPKIEKALQKYTGGAVSMIDATNGGLRSTYDVLKDLAKVYPTLSKEAKAYLNEVLAGNRQNKVLVAIMENWEDVEKAQQTATNSAGSAMAENEKYLDSIAGKTAQLKNKFQEFADSIVNSGLVKFVLDLSNAFMTFANNGVGNVIIKLTLLATALMAVSAGFSLLKQSMLGQAFIEYGKRIADFIKLQTVLYAQTKAQTIATWQEAYAQVGLAGAIKATTLAMMSNPLFLGAAAIGATVGIIALLVKNIDTYEKKLKRATEANDKAQQELEESKNKLDEVNSKLKETEKRIYELENQPTLTFVEKDELKNQKEQNALLQIELETRKKINEEKEKTAKEKANELYNTKYNDNEGRHANYNLKDDQYYDEQGRPLPQPSMPNPKSEYVFGYANWLMKAADAYEIFNEKVNDGVELTDKQKESFEKARQVLSNGIDELMKEIPQLSGETKQQAEQLFDYLYSRLSPDLWKELKITNFLNSEDGEEVNNILKQLTTQGKITEATIQALANDFPELAKFMKESGITAAEWADNYTNFVLKAQNSMDTLLDKYSSLEDRLGVLKDAQQEYNETGKISIDTFKELMENDLLDYLEITGNGIKFNTEALSENANALKENMIEAVKLSAAEQILQIVNNDVEESADAAAGAVAGYATTLDTSTQSDAEKIASNIGVAASYDAVKAAANGEGLDTSKWDKHQKEIEDVLNGASKQIAAINKLGVGTKGGSKSSSSKEWWEKELDAIKKQFDNSEITIEEYISRLENLKGKLKEGSDAWKEVDKVLKETKITKVENDYKKGAISLEEYIKRLKELLSLYKEGSKGWENLANKIKSAQKELLSSYKDQFEQAHDAASKALDDEIDRLEKAREETEKYYDEKIDALKEANEEQNKALELEKAMQALEKAKNEKTKRVWHENIGWVWEADEEAIKEAEKNLNDIVTENAIDDLEKERDEALKVFDDQIDAIEKYKDSWEEITEDYENQQARLQAAQIMGANWERDILGQRLTTLEDFRNRYNALLAELGSYDNRSDANIALSGDVPQFSNGGKVDFTGMAMLHGSPNNPEWVLNNTQMENFIKTLNRPRVDRIGSSVGQSSTYNYSFDKIVLPNVTNTSQFINALKNLNNVTNNQ